jgi:Peptidase family M28
VNATASGGFSRRTLLGTALLAALPGLARRASASTHPAFDGARALRDVERLVAIGPRPPGSVALARTRTYIATELRGAGWRVREHPFMAHTPRGPLTMTNVIAEWPGRGTEIVAVGGHYDTKVFEKFRFVGANDGGSSTALLSRAPDRPRLRGAAGAERLLAHPRGHAGQALRGEPPRRRHGDPGGAARDRDRAVASGPVSSPRPAAVARVGGARRCRSGPVPRREPARPGARALPTSPRSGPA